MPRGFTEGFCTRAFEILCIDGIERGKRSAHQKRLVQPKHQTNQAEPGMLHGPIGQIDSRQPCASLGKALVVRAQPDIHFQHIPIE